jgi:hypothetical protein
MLVVTWLQSAANNIVYLLPAAFPKDMKSAQRPAEFFNYIKNVVILTKVLD